MKLRDWLVWFACMSPAIAILIGAALALTGVVRIP